MKVIPANHAIHARWSPRTLSGVKEGLVEDGRGERTFRFAMAHPLPRKYQIPEKLEPTKLFCPQRP